MYQRELVKMGKILIIGSSNTDLIAKINNFPGAGETIQGLSFLQAMGGKGANQAMAAHKLGGNVKFITCVGDDPNGQNAMIYYREEGLDVSSSLVKKGISSGTAMILVDEKGENCIVIIPGANHLLTPEYIFQMEQDISQSDMVVMQMEIPYQTVKKACELSKKHEKTVLLNVAPACKLDEELIRMVDILVVNETEAETITGEKITEKGEEYLLDSLLSMGVGNVVLTLGKKGCLMRNHETFFSYPAIKVDAVDSTAAGDTFCGALASKLSKGYDWPESLKFATAASAICVTRFGAQPSIPTEHEVLEFLKNNVVPEFR